MTKITKIDDAVRIRVLEGLLAKGTIVPHLNQLQQVTGLHKTTLKASIDFLKKEGVLGGFGPKVNFRRFGFGLEVISLLQVDLSETALFEAFVKQALDDPHFYDLSPVIGQGNWNLMARHFYKDIESFHKNEEENYFKKIPGLFRLIRDRHTFYVTEPHYKSSSRTFSILETIKREKGLV